MPDYYEVLGIDEEASEYQITQAYRDLAKQYHPDKFPKKRFQYVRSKDEPFTSRRKSTNST